MLRSVTAPEGAEPGVVRGEYAEGADWFVSRTGARPIAGRAARHLAAVLTTNVT